MSRLCSNAGFLALLCLVWLIAPLASAAESMSHDDPVTSLLLGISIILLAAKLGGHLLVRLGQPAVLGELLVGVVLGNLVLIGFDRFEFLRPEGFGAHRPA